MFCSGPHVFRQISSQFETAEMIHDMVWILQVKVDTDTDKISDWCRQSLRNDEKHEASS